MVRCSLLMRLKDLTLEELNQEKSAIKRVVNDFEEYDTCRST